MYRGIKEFLHAIWLRQNIKKDDALIRNALRLINILEKEKGKIHELLELLSHFTLGVESRAIAGKEEFKLALIEKTLEDYAEYLQELDEHMIKLLLQATMVGDDFSFLESLGFTVETGPPPAEDELV